MAKILSAYEGRFGELKARFRSLTPQKALSLLGLFAVIAAIPLTVLIGQQQQDIRQQAAAGSEVVFVDSQANTITQTSSPTVQVKLTSPWPGSQTVGMLQNTEGGLKSGEVAGASTATFQVISGADDVNQDGTTFIPSSSTIWLGNGQSATSSYTGLRFTGVSIPKGATITSAKLQVRSSSNQWIGISMSMAAENSGNSAAFSASSKPSQRLLTASKVNHSSNANWVANTSYSLDEMSPVIQEVINRSDWNSGNALSVILKGTGSSYGRKFIASGTTTNFAKLIVTYDAGGIQSTTVLPTTVPTPALSPICQVVFNKIQASFTSTCGDARYDPVADIDKDTFVRIIDFSTFRAGSAGGTDDVACQAYLNNTTNPCVSPTPLPTSVQATLTPVPVTTVSFDLAEDAGFTINKVTIPFTIVPIAYTFSNANPGTKTLFVRFIASDGRMQNAMPFPATIELVVPTAMPTQIPLLDIGATLSPYPLPSRISLVAGQSLKFFDMTSTGASHADFTMRPYAQGVYMDPAQGYSFITGQTRAVNIGANLSTTPGVYNYTANITTSVLGPNNTTLTKEFNHAIEVTVLPAVPTLTPTLTPTPVVTTTPTPTPRSTPLPRSLDGTYKRVFITSTTYKANFGSLIAADAKCQERANVASLEGTWKAWLSSTSVSAGQRVIRFSQYRLLNGYFANEPGKFLFSSANTLQNPINITELLTRFPYTNVWSNTNADGSITSTLPSQSCFSWTVGTGTDSSGAVIYGKEGNPQRVDSGWSEYGGTDCGQSGPLYCFEQ